MQIHASGYYFKFNVTDWDWSAVNASLVRVIVERPNGTKINRIAPPDVDVDVGGRTVSLLLKIGDIPLVGRYYFQAFDETAGNAPTEVGVFTVHTDDLKVLTLP